PATAWTSPFSNAVGSVLTIPLDPTIPTSTLTLTQPLDRQHSAISRVVVTIGTTSTAIDVPAPDQSGRSTITVPSASADSMTVTIDAIDPRTTIDRRYGEPTVLPVAIDEIAASSIVAPRPVIAETQCRTDLVSIDG